MNDKIFLQWLHDRLIHVYGENENTDFLHKLRAIVKSTPEDKTTFNELSGAPETIHEKAWQAFNQSKEPTAKGQLKDALEVLFND